MLPRGMNSDGFNAAKIFVKITNLFDKPMNLLIMETCKIAISINSVIEYLLCQLVFCIIIIDCIF